MPQRIQLSRAAGWRKPPGAIVVARPTRWGNPYRVTDGRSRAEAVKLYRQALDAGSGPRRADIRRELGGHDLACWCPLTEPRHADVLLAIANE